MPIRSGKRRYASGKRALSVSDRSGLSFRHKDMRVEQGTKLLVHKSEDDGQWNAVDYEKHRVIPEADAQRLPNPRDYTAQEVGEEYTGPSEFF